MKTYTPPAPWAGTFGLKKGIKATHVIGVSGNARQRRRQVRKWKAEDYTVHELFGPNAGKVR